MDLTKLNTVFESAGIDNSAEITSAVETFVSEQLQTQQTQHDLSVVELKESFVEEKQSLIESQLEYISEQKEESQQLIDTLIDKNTELQSLSDDFESVKEQLVEFTMDKLNKEYDENLEMFFSKVAESWVEDKDRELTEISESTAQDFGMRTIAEALGNSGFDLNVDESDVMDKLNNVEEELQSVIKENTLLKQGMKDIEKEILIEESIEGLTGMDGQRLRSVAENMEFKDTDSFKLALKYMKSSMGTNPKKRKSSMSNVQEDLTTTFGGSDDQQDDLISATLSVLNTI